MKFHQEKSGIRKTVSLISLSVFLISQAVPAVFAQNGPVTLESKGLQATVAVTGAAQNLVPSPAPQAAIKNSQDFLTENRAISKTVTLAGIQVLGETPDFQVTSQKNGSYSVKIGTVVYQSKNGAVTVPGIGTVACRFDGRGQLTTMTVFDPQDTLHRKATIRFVQSEGKDYVSQVEYVSDDAAENHLLTVNYKQKYIEYTNTFGSHGGSEVTFFDGDLRDEFFLALWPSAGFGSTSVFSATLCSNADGSVHQLVIRANNSQYEVLQVGGSDMSKGNLAALKDRTLQGYQRLLKNDKLVRIGQDVTVGGTIFKVVSVTEGKISLQSEAGVILNSATDAKGNVTLSVPQAGGTTKIYNVKIDPQGVITLSLRAK